MEVITNPVIPLFSTLPRAFSVGNGVRIFGSVVGSAESQMFHICLQCGNELDASDVALDVLVSTPDATATVNSMRSGVWDEAQHIPSIPIRNNQKFEILLKCDTSLYKIFINTRYYCGFPQRIPFDFITHIVIYGDILVEKICFEEESLAIETPPPSYDEAEARAYARQANDGAPLLQATPGRPPYPSDTNPLFRPVADRNNQPHLDTYFAPYRETDLNVTSTALNPASPNFRVIRKSKTAQLIKGLCIVFFIVLLIGVSILLGSSKHKKGS